MNEKTVGMLIGKKNVYEYPELSNAVTCMNYVNKETEIPPVLMMHGLADDKAWRSGILDREEYGYCGKISESPHGLRWYRLYYLLYSIPDLQCNVSGVYLYRGRIWNSGSNECDRNIAGSNIWYNIKISTCGKLQWIFLISVYFIMCIALRTSLHRRYLSS